MSSRVPVSVLIAARNEAENIAACIQSVCWADQIVVVDSQSTDETDAIAENLGAEVVQFEYDGGWPKKRNWALDNVPLRNEWVFVLDADERIGPELAAEIREAVASNDFDGYYVRWKFVFLSRWMKHCWNHGWMPRLFRRGKGRYEDLGMRNEGGWDAEVHENIVVDGRCGRLRGLLDHNSEKSLSAWVRKQNEFSDWNARRRLELLAQPLPPLSQLFSGDPVRQRKLLKAVFLRMPLRPTLMFLWLYVVKQGFLDGVEGFYFCRLRAMHELNIDAKMFELQRRSR